MTKVEVIMPSRASLLSDISGTGVSSARGLAWLRQWQRLPIADLQLRVWFNVSCLDAIGRRFGL